MCVHLYVHVYKFVRVCICMNTRSAASLPISLSLGSRSITLCASVSRYILHARSHCPADVSLPYAFVPSPFVFTLALIVLSRYSSFHHLTRSETLSERPLLSVHLLQPRPMRIFSRPSAALPLRLTPMKINVASAQTNIHTY